MENHIPMSTPSVNLHTILCLFDFLHSLMSCFIPIASQVQSPHATKCRLQRFLQWALFSDLNLQKSVRRAACGFRFVEQLFRITKGTRPGVLALVSRNQMDEEAVSLVWVKPKGAEKTEEFCTVLLSFRT